MTRFSCTCAVWLASLWISDALGESLTNSGLPDVRKGDVAVYQITDLRTGEKGRPNSIHVEEVTDDLIVTRSGTTIRKYTREWNLLEVAPYGKIDDIADPHLPQFRFPLQVGNRWSALVTAKSIRSSIINRHEWHGVSLAASRSVCRLEHTTHSNCRSRVLIPVSGVITCGLAVGA